MQRESHSPPLLSVFHRSAAADIRTVAQSIEYAGYRRLWTSEHRSTPVTPAPIMLAAIAAASTSKLAVATAGVMLRYASPQSIAEQFVLLDALFPNRVAIGIISGRDRDPTIHTELLDGREDASMNHEHRLARLLELMRSADAGSRRSERLWACTLSERSVQFAAAHGLGFAFHRFLSREAGLGDGIDLATCYRSHFVRREDAPGPQLAAVCFGTCAKDAATARRLWIARFGEFDDGTPKRPGSQPGPDFLGCPEECHEQLSHIGAALGATEIAIHCADVSLEGQTRQYDAIADQFRL